jgi:hypothetical protein
MGKMGYSCLGFLLVLTLLAPPFGWAQEVTERLPNGEVNWTRGVVTAKGNGAPPSGITVPSQARLMAERAAKADAMRNLLEAVKGVRVDSETTVETYTARNDRVLTRVSGIVIGARVVNTRYLSDGSVEVTVGVNLTGELLAVMLQEIPTLARPLMPSPPIPSSAAVRPPPPPRPTPGIPPEKKPLSAPPPPPQPSPPPPRAKETKEPPPPARETGVVKPPGEAEKLDLKKLEYTGLIVDARKLGLRPALIPKILNEKGELIYSSRSVEQQELIRMGLVGYAKDVNAAARNQRVTADPYVVSGLHATGEKKTDVVISNRDAQIVLTTAPYTGYLRNGRVMVVYD